MQAWIAWQVRNPFYFYLITLSIELCRPQRRCTITEPDEGRVLRLLCAVHRSQVVDFKATQGCKLTDIFYTEAYKTLPIYEKITKQPQRHPSSENIQHLKGIGLTLYMYIPSFNTLHFDLFWNYVSLWIFCLWLIVGADTVN